MLLLFLLLVAHPGAAFITPGDTQALTSSRLYYNYFKKDGEKREIGRLWKNIIFPGIYQEYQDTAEPKKTIKVKTQSKWVSSRNGDDSFFSQDPKSGTYNVVDPNTVPKEVSAISIKARDLKPVRKPDNFVLPPTPKDMTLGLGAAKVLPGLTPRPSKPFVLYEYEANGECKKVREACTLLDLTLDCRPCPAGATSGFSDQLATVSLGQRTVPFMIDNNGKMYR